MRLVIYIFLPFLLIFAQAGGAKIERTTTPPSISFPGQILSGGELVTTFPTNILAVGSNWEYVSISSALSEYDFGDIILLAPETFNEDINIDTDSVVIMGMSKRLTKINNLRIAGKYITIENLTVMDSTIITSQKIGDYDYSWRYENKLENIIFLGEHFYFGEPTIKTSFFTSLYDCEFLGVGKLIYLNGDEHGNRFENCRLQTWPNKNKVIIKEGDFRFYGNNKFIGIDTLEYVNSNNEFAAIVFINVDRVYVGNIITLTDNTNWAALVFRKSWAEWGSAFTINGKFELVVDYSDIDLRYDLVFNSTALSRFQGMHQIGYNSNATISGSGLSNLVIYQSIFRMDAPSGLAADSCNVWGAIIDN